ncbi:MAG: SUMF1/EgtB/PvdO family nonheme iron enzyme [Myxococcales bacterium]|nr:SUMF1/EgtB/PvdO family nonheme iron enzyme [Myxococcales bacterium]
MRRRRQLVGFALVAAVTAACSISVVGTLDVAPTPPDGGREASLPGEGEPVDGALGDGGAPGDASSDGGALDAAFSCPSDAGPMVRTDAGFCVDVTEVSNAQYLPFYESTQVAAPPAPPGCAWNVDFKPSVWRMNAPYFSEPDFPARAVDWCDAWAYCAWAGKRLCGDLAGGPASATDGADASANAWTYACSSGGATVYPYGNNYNQNACNGDNEIGGATAVGSLAGCVGGGVYDMSGNMWEWEDSCVTVTGAGDSCRVRGGSHTRPEGQLTCATSFATPRSDATGNNGIRCCAYPP